MEAKYLVLLVLCAAILLAGTAEGDEAHKKPTNAATAKTKARLQDKMEAVSDLAHEAARLKKQRRNERSSKAQGAVAYMEKYKAGKATIASEKARLRDKIQRDKAYLVSQDPKLKKAHERHKKHDQHVQATMKRAIVAMKRVNQLVSGKQKEDPTVKAAQKANAKQGGKEIFTVLGLDSNQLGKDYLLAMDAAVAAYDAKPSAASEKRLETAIKTSKERMKKEAKLERQKKSEVRAKKERTEKNQAYYKQKWSEKRREMGRKRVQRDALVKRLKKEMKTKAWVRRKNEDEIEKKSGKKKSELTVKKNKENAVKTLKNKKARAKLKIKGMSKAKWNTKQKKLDDIATSKKGIARKKHISLKRAKEAQAKAKIGMEREAKAVSAATKASASAAKAFGTANEKKGKQASELNGKSATKAQLYMRARKTVLQKANFREKSAKAKMKVKVRGLAVAKLAYKAAVGVKAKAIKKAALHKASKGAKKKKKFFSKKSSPKRVKKRL